MKKYKQVLAAFVAMNLTVYVMPTGIVKISASVESQEDKNTTETALSAESENAAAGESENTVSVGMTENTEAATASEEGTSESAETEDDTAFLCNTTMNILFYMVILMVIFFPSLVGYI